MRCNLGLLIVLTECPPQALGPWGPRGHLPELPGQPCLLNSLHLLLFTYKNMAVF